MIVTKIEKAVEKGIRKGVEKGVERGIVKGLEKSLDKTLDSKIFEEKLSIVKNLILSGVDDLLISNCTGMSPDEIMRYRSRL